MQTRITTDWLISTAQTLSSWVLLLKLVATYCVEALDIIYYNIYLELKTIYSDDLRSCFFYQI